MQFYLNAANRMAGESFYECGKQYECNDRVERNFLRDRIERFFQCEADRMDRNTRRVKQI